MKACPFPTVLVFAWAISASAWADDLFEKSIRPLLTEHCVSCHGEAKQKGGLRLDVKSGWERGGDSGPAIRPGKPQESLLLKAVMGKDGLSPMPPKKRLSEREVAALERWVREGAADPRDGGPVKLGGTTVEGARRWWSFQPITRQAVPAGDFANPIDAFISAKLLEKGLKLSPSADRRTLLRRVTYDLTGLPPTMAEMEAFEKDASTDALSKVVDRLLDSQAYGERWGRHWLDLVRYADTAGENADYPVADAWRYRNWVIEAVRQDMPYNQFLREQLAGDLLAQREPDERYASRIIATGFLAMARRFDHDSDKSMHLTHEDGIDTLGKALLGLTLGCARCHDHKYDAVTTRDYYALYGIFQSTKFAFPGCEAKQQPRDMVRLASPAQWERTIRPQQERLASIESQLKEANDSQTKAAHQTLEIFRSQRRTLSQGEIPDGGEAAITGGNDVINVKPGQMILLSITPLRNHGADSTLVEWEIAETDGLKRKWNVTSDLLGDFLAGNPHADSHGNAGVWAFFDARNRLTLLPEKLRDLSGTIGLHVWRNGDTPSVFVNAATQEHSLWTKLPGRTLFAHPAPDGNVALAWISPIEGQVTIHGRLKDVHPGGPDGIGWVLEHSQGDARQGVAKQAKTVKQVPTLTQERDEIRRSMPAAATAYAVVEGQPGDTRLHLRGDPEKLGDVVPRRWLEVLGGQPLADPKSSGRLELADWIASKNNPLTARVMANRLWLHHLGRGLVATPNDLGTRGSPPSHPQLLDWLASEFIDSGWSLKAMHRRIILSQTYQQSGDVREDGRRIDPMNELFWRSQRRRLSAEEIRDSLLAISGRLDPTPGEAHPLPPVASWRYTQHEPFGTFYDTNRRSIYLIQIRNRRHPFLGLFDGADPNATTPQRQTTTVPSQALYFMNDPFFHEQAAALTQRLLALTPLERLDALFRSALQRSAAQRDRDFAASFLHDYAAAMEGRSETERETEAWRALSRIVLASNEFLFVE